MKTKKLAEKSNFKELWLSPEVTQALESYNFTIENALIAAQKLEAIAITARLSRMFWVSEKKTAKMIKKDYVLNTVYP